MQLQWRYVQDKENNGIMTNGLFIKLCHWVPKVPFFQEWPKSESWEVPFLSEKQENKKIDFI